MAPSFGAGNSARLAQELADRRAGGGEEEHVHDEVSKMEREAGFWYVLPTKHLDLSARGGGDVEIVRWRRILGFCEKPRLFRKWTKTWRNDVAAAPATATEVKPRGSLRTRSLDSSEWQRLREAGPVAIPLLLAAVADPVVFERPPGNHVMDKSASRRHSTCWRCPRRLVGHRSRPGSRATRIIKSASMHCTPWADVAQDEAIEALSSGLKDADEDIRTYTLMGLMFLKGSSRGSPEFRKVLFDAALPLLNDPK